jgi:HK97 gp10 family phage protein
MKIEGLDKLLEQFEKLKGIDREKVGLAGGYTLLAESQKITPVDTGFLRQSGYCEGVKDKGSIVGFSAEYAYFIEFGTSRMQPKSFLRKAIDTKGDLIVTAMKNESDKQIKGVING